MTVDEYVETKVLPQFQQIVAMLRQLMRDTAPGAEEVMSYGMPVYRAKRIFAWIGQGKNDIIVAFARGTQIDDRYGLLKGTGRSSRHVRIKRLDVVDKEALIYYIQQAFALDQQ